MNFDRIAHLVKLVFGTRIVVVSLVDGTEEYVLSFFTFSLEYLSRCTGSLNLNVCFRSSLDDAHRS